MAERSWISLVTETAAHLLDSNRFFTWDDLARAFYKRKPHQRETDYIIERRKDIVRRLRDKIGRYVHTVNNKYTPTMDTPVNAIAAAVFLPNSRHPAIGIRLAREDDVIYTAFILRDCTRERGSLQGCTGRVETATTERLLVQSHFAFNREEHLAIFLRPTKMISGPEGGNDSD